MNELRNRLAGCFSTIFPGLAQAEISQASQASIAQWDSIATLTLLNVIDEEFQVQIDLEDVADLDSFERVLAYLRVRLDGTGSA